MTFCVHVCSGFLGQWRPPSVADLALLCRTCLQAATEAAARLRHGLIFWLYSLQSEWGRVPTVTGISSGAWAWGNCNFPGVLSRQGTRVGLTCLKMSVYYIRHCGTASTRRNSLHGKLVKGMCICNVRPGLKPSGQRACEASRPAETDHLRVRVTLIFV